MREATWLTAAVFCSCWLWLLLRSLMPLPPADIWVKERERRGKERNFDRRRWMGFWGGEEWKATPRSTFMHKNPPSFYYICVRTLTDSSTQPALYTKEKTKDTKNKFKETRLWCPFPGLRLICMGVGSFINLCVGMGCRHERAGINFFGSHGTSINITLGFCSPSLAPTAAKEAVKFHGWGGACGVCNHRAIASSAITSNWRVGWQLLKGHSLVATFIQGRLEET